MGYQGRIEEVETRFGLAEFINLPYRLYRDDPYWVAPLRRDQRFLFDRHRHPFHQHSEVALFLAVSSGGEIEGRIASIVNHAHNRYHGDKVGFFGFLEGIRSPELFEALLGRASEWLAARGMDTVRGPMNFSTNEECGMLVDGFDDSPQLMMPYNRQWYPELLEKAGFVKAVDLLAYRVDRETDFDRLSRIAEMVGRRSSGRIRAIDMGSLDTEIPKIMDVYNECWRDNWGFVPMTEAELSRMAEELRLILEPELAPIVEVDGRAVAFAVGLPDANQALKVARGSTLRAILALKVPLFRVSINRLRVLLMGVREAYRGRGFEALLIDRIVRQSEPLGIDEGELSWILEGNRPMRDILEKDLGADQYKTYRIYEKKL
jgi:GNAT superfamily N-acetyltransferase